MSTPRNMKDKRTVIDLDDSDDDVQVNDAVLAPRGSKKSRTEGTTQSAPATSSGAASPASTPPATPPTGAPTSAMRSFEITVEALARFKTFYPERATSAIATQYHTEILSVMHAYQTSTPLHIQHRYTVMRATAHGTSAAFTTSALSAPTPSLCYANALLLELFPAVNPRVVRGKEKPTYLWLTTKTGIKNPQFAKLHAVRYNEVGCGMDDDGCLSMCVVEAREGERVTRAMYVLKGEVEVEEEENENENEDGDTEEEVNLEEVDVGGGDEDDNSLFMPEGN